MGWFRLFLALSVLVWHADAPYWKPLYGGLAVSTFYVISGFYMQLLVTEKFAGRPKWVLDFWKSRALRIFPLYWLFALVAIPIASDPLLRILADGSALERVFVIASNAFIFGLDLNHFMHVTSDGGIAMGYGEPSAAYLALIGPSWSLAIELGFYLLAPFLLVRGTRALLIVIAASIALRIAVSSVDPHAVYGFSETWNGVLPSELATFLVGALGYRFYRAAPDRAVLARIGPLMLVLIALYVLFYTRMGGRFPRLMVPYFGFVALTALALPFVFSWTRDRAIDRFVGELSYPVYLSHGLILSTLTYQLGMAGGARVIAAIVVSIVLGAALVISVERPLQRFRNARFVEGRPPHTGAPAAAVGSLRL